MKAKQSKIDSRSGARRVGIILQGGGRWNAGVVYVANLLLALQRLTDNQPKFEPVVLLDPRSPKYLLKQEVGNNFTTASYSIFSQQSCLEKSYWISHDLMRLQAPQCLETLIKRHSIDLVFPVQSQLGANFPVPWGAWISDFQHLHFPHYFSRSQIAKRNRLCEHHLEHANLIVVSSNTAAADFTARYKDSAKLQVLPFRTILPQSILANVPETAAERRGLPRKFFFFPSQFWIHKNHFTLFKAIAQLKKMGVHDIALLCCGREEDSRHPRHASFLKTWIKENDLQEQIQCLGHLPRVEQIQLMRMCTGIVQPSLFEGWSALVEDARALGKPLILSDIPIHREQAPPKATYFSVSDPNSEYELANILAEQWRILEPGWQSTNEQQAQIAYNKCIEEFSKNFKLTLNRVSMSL